MIITMRHVRQAKMCAAGARAFCLRHGIDWNSFLKQGVESEIVLKTGDAMAIEVVEKAHG